MYIGNISGIGNAQGANILQSTIAHRPAAGFVNTLFIASDNLTLYRDNGIGWDAISSGGSGAFIGGTLTSSLILAQDPTLALEAATKQYVDNLISTSSVGIAGNGLTLTNSTFNIGTASTARIVINADNIDLAPSGITAGNYKSVTVDIYGRVTGGSNPTTISGYGITDAYTKTEVGTAITSGISAIPKASSTVLGLVKVGSGLSIDATGILSATGSGSGGGSTAASNSYQFKVNFTGSAPTSLANLPTGWTYTISGNTINVTHTAGSILKFISYLGYISATNNFHYRQPTSGNEMSIDAANKTTTFAFTINTSVVGADNDGYAYVNVSFDDAAAVAPAPTGNAQTYQFRVDFAGSNPSTVSNLPSGWTYTISSTDITITHSANSNPKFLSYLGYTASTNSYHYRQPSSANEMMIDGSAPLSKFTFRINTAVVASDNDGYAYINVNF
jgi:hypothetical protein